MKIDLSDVKEGDTVFSIDLGVRKVDIVNYGTITIQELNYRFDGIEEYDEPDYPTCFHSIEECIEYFQSVKKEMEEASKPKKRYWLFSIKSGKTWTKDMCYLDDRGYDTAGMIAFDNWFDREKIKHKNEFIDV